MNLYEIVGLSSVITFSIQFEFRIGLNASMIRTLNIKLPSPPDMPRGMTHYVWFAPDLGVTVKEQIGNGAMNWTQILEKVQTSEGGS